MKARKTDFALENHLPYLINRIAMMGVRAFGKNLDPEHITVPMWRVIAVLWTTGAQRQVDLSELTSIDPSTLSRLIGTLSKMKLVNRQRSSESSREVTIYISGKGEQLAEKLVPIANQYEELQLKGLSREERLLLKILLTKVYTNIAEQV